MWFLTRLGESGPAYNVVSAIRMRGALDTDALAAAIHDLAQRHDALRTRFPAVNGEPYQDIQPEASIPLTRFDCDTEEQLHDSLMADAWTGFDLERGPLLRMAVYRLSETDHVLSLVMHHIISDGWTTGVIIRELSALYRARLRGELAELPPLPVQYADFTEWQHKQFAGPRMAELLRHWQARVDGMPRILELPTDFRRPDDQTFRGRWLNFRLDAELTEGIEQLGRGVNADAVHDAAGGIRMLLGRVADRATSASACRWRTARIPTWSRWSDSS